MLDGVFAEGDDGILEFHAAEAPSEEEVARLLATVYRRVRRLLARRGLEVDHILDVDPLAEESPALAGISSASIQGRIALGPRAGARVFQLGREPDAPWVTSRGRARRTSRASTSTRTSRSQPTTARASSASAATCFARPRRRSVYPGPSGPSERATRASAGPPPSPAPRSPSRPPRPP